MIVLTSPDVSRLPSRDQREGQSHPRSEQAILEIFGLDLFLTGKTIGMSRKTALVEVEGRPFSAREASEYTTLASLDASGLL
jgi:hypothetical protein